MGRPRHVLASAVVAGAAWASSSCGGGLADQALVDSVRILASRADPPYAAPGSTVDLTVLAVDERPTKPAPMTLSWLPVPCMNPPDDAYYACFPQFSGLAAGALDGGAGAAGAALGPGVDLTPLLPTGDTFQFTMPADAIADAGVPAAPIPFGLAILFNVACAGHLELVPLDPNNPQSPPIGCFDAQHDQLGPSDYVFGFTRVYAFAPDAGDPNTNPVIDHVDLDGQPVALPPAAPITLPPCVGSCAHRIGPVVPPSSQETDYEEIGPNGQPLKEQIWATFYATFGSFNSDVRLLYDPVLGSVGDPSVTDAEFTPPSSPGAGTIWIVVHDSRGGASWATLPVSIQSGPGDAGP